VPKDSRSSEGPACCQSDDNVPQKNFSCRVAFDGGEGARHNTAKMAEAFAFRRPQTSPIKGSTLNQELPGYRRCVSVACHNGHPKQDVCEYNWPEPGVAIGNRGHLGLEKEQDTWRLPVEWKQ
jgi:hypothetical protein